MGKLRPRESYTKEKPGQDNPGILMSLVLSVKYTEKPKNRRKGKN